MSAKVFVVSLKVIENYFYSPRNKQIYWTSKAQVTKTRISICKSQQNEDLETTKQCD